MATRNSGASPSPLTAVQAVYDALEPLDDGARLKVLASVSALLGMVSPSATGLLTPHQEDPSRAQLTTRGQTFDRPKSLVELMQEKEPKNNAQKLALFAYYRERVEEKSRFAKADLKSYFATAKEKPAGNYDRDFAQAVKAGWIHEDGADSYLTSRGLEAVESGFTAKQPSGSKKSAKKSSKVKAGTRTPKK